MKKIANELNIYSGIAIIFVVLIHSSAYYLTRVLGFDTYADAGYFLTTIDQIIHVAVPMFIFIAGFKHQLSNKQISYKKFFKKRLSKVLVPFLYISIFFILADIAVAFLFENVSIVSSIYNFGLNFVNIFIGYNLAYQLWYIPMYLFVVLSYPIISRYLKSQKTRLIVFSSLSIGWVFVSYLIGTFSEYPFSFVYYFIFFELGCYVAVNKMNKNQVKILYVVYLVLLIISIYGASINLHLILTYLLLTPISVVVFYYIALSIKENKVLETLGKYSFYIFLFHDPIILTYISNIFYSLNFYNGYHVTLVVAGLSILLSIVIYKILEKIGLAKFIFMEFNTSKIKVTSKTIAD